MRTLIIISFILSGCASTKCFIETGVGYWVEKDLAPTGTPSELNAYCEKNNIAVGWYHTSDITRGRPFNGKEELSTDAIMIKYKKRIY